MTHRSKLATLILGVLLMAGMGTTALMANEGKCGDDKKEKAGKYDGEKGEKSGYDKKEKAGKCGDDKKEKAGKCGAGKCGNGK